MSRSEFKTKHNCRVTEPCEECNYFYENEASEGRDVCNVYDYELADQ